MPNELLRLRWSPWICFLGGNFSSLSSEPGLYRVRAVNSGKLVYIGQTGRNLRERLRCLRTHTLADEMPYNDPHTAAPRLWSWRAAEGMEFECSTASVSVPKRDLIGREHLLIWRYRQKHGASPLCNFGRCHPGYYMPGNRSTGKSGGKLATQQKTKPQLSNTRPLKCMGFQADPNWMGLDWRQLLDVSKVKGPGVYRILDKNRYDLLYIGQSSDLRPRLESHLQQRWKGSKISIDVALQPAGTPKYILLEIENDLLAGFFSIHGHLPICQYLPRTTAIL